MLNLYYATTKESIRLEDIDGDAIIFIGKDYCQTMYLIRQKQIQEISQFKPNHLAEISSLINSCWSSLSKAEGLIVTDNESERASFIRQLTFFLNFPYDHASVRLSNDGKSLIIKPRKTYDNIHPLLKKYTRSNLIQFLRELKQEELNIKPYINFIQINPDKNIWAPPYCSISPDQMIDRALQANHPDYKYAFNKIEKISTRFLESPITSMKKKILDSFRKYCVEHAENKLSRSDLIENWAKNYISQNNQNPFEILNTHRRSTGLISFFNPVKTDSILLFERLLVSEKVSMSLQKMMQPHAVAEIEVRQAMELKPYAY